MHIYTHLYIGKRDWLLPIAHVTLQLLVSVLGPRTVQKFPFPNLTGLSHSLLLSV